MEQRIYRSIVAENEQLTAPLASMYLNTVMGHIRRATDNLPIDSPWEAGMNDAFWVVDRSDRCGQGVEGATQNAQMQ